MGITSGELPDPLPPPGPPAATPEKIDYVAELQRGVRRLSEQRKKEIEENRAKAARNTSTNVVK